MCVWEGRGGEGGMKYNSDTKKVSYFTIKDQFPKVHVDGSVPNTKEVD